MGKVKDSAIYQFARKGYRRVKDKVHKYKKLKKRYPACYREAAKQPVQENKVVFIELRLPNLTNSFQTMYDELSLYYDFDIHCHYLRTTFVSRAEHERRCIEMIKDVATAKYVFLNEASNVFSSLPIREETVVTQLWHGCGAFKKFGMSTADLIFGENRRNMLKYPFNKNYTHVTVSSPEVAWAYEEAMNIPKESGIIKALGSSRTDVFYDDIFIRKAYQKLHNLMPETKGKKVILFAPTFRGRVAEAASPDCFDVAMFAENLSDEYVLLFKHHPLVRVRPEIPEEYKDFARDFTDTMGIDELLCVSDICISDYSSLVFEYSLFEKPLIFYAYDLDEYFDWRGFYYDYHELAPGPIVTTNEEMIDYIKNIDTRFERDKIVAFREKFMSSCDGKATKRILETMMGNDVLEKHQYGYEQFKDDVKVSVIVPVYNCAEYLIECMDTITHQTLREIEIICVNDGSTDDSLDILEYYAKKDSRVRIINQKNSYAGVARNNGLEKATGKYVVFWDGDDFFSPTALEYMYKQCEEDQADICVSGARRFDEATKEYLYANVYLKKKYLPEQVPFSKKDMPQYIFNFATNVPWNKMYRREFVENHQLRFQDLKQANDTYFVMMALFLAERITYVDRKPVRYRVNNSKSITGKSTNTEFCVRDAYVKVYDEIRKHPDYNEQIHQSFVNRALSGLLVSALGSQNNFDGYKKVWEWIKNEGLSTFDISGHDKEYYYSEWQYEEMLKMQESSMEEFLHFVAKREQRNIQLRKNDAAVARKQAEKLEETIEKNQEKIEKLKKRLNSKTVQTAYRLKKIVTLNGLLVRTKKEN